MKGTIILFFLFVSVNGFSQSYPDDCLDSLNVPSIFTADGDGINEGISIDFPCPPEEFEYSIYNRWGSLIYKTDDYEFHWTGENKDGDPVHGGDYFWVLKYTFNGAEFSKTGSLNVLM